MDGLAAFLAARLDDDEGAATPGRRALDDLRFELRGGDECEQHLSSRIEDGLDVQTVAWQARALRAAAAQRAILALHYMDSDDYIDGDGIERAAFICHECDNFGRSDNWPCRTLRHLAAIWSDHPDYRQEWAPLSE